MKNSIKVGQVLWLRVRYQIDKIADVKHPMLIIDINDEYIEVVAMDKTAGKIYNLFHKYNLYIDSKNPKETVIFEDSYAQLNTKITIENFPELSFYKKTNDLLSAKKLNNVINEYRTYQDNNLINEDRIVYMTKEEIELLNN